MRPHVIAPQVGDEGIVTRIARDNVEKSGRIEHGRAPDVVGEREDEGIAPRSCEPNQMDRASVLKKFFDQRRIELSLFWSEQQSETDRLLTDNR